MKQLSIELDISAKDYIDFIIKYPKCFEKGQLNPWVIVEVSADLFSSVTDQNNLVTHESLSCFEILAKYETDSEYFCE